MPTSGGNTSLEEQWPTEAIREKRPQITPTEEEVEEIGSCVDEGCKPSEKTMLSKTFENF